MRFLFTWFQTQFNESFESGLPFEERISWAKSSFLPLKVCELVSLRFCDAVFILFPIATFGNILAIRALLKASSIPDNINKFFLSLAVSDLAMRLFAQLMYAVVFEMAADVGHNFDLLCPTILTVWGFSSFLLACASSLNVTAIAVDRLLAITLHLRYAIPETCHFKARHNSLSISLAHKWWRCFSVRFA